jgi:cell division protein ZapA
MAQVTVSIDGRQYRMACGEGEEGHLADLAQDLDRRIGELRETFGEIGELRLAVMAALSIADELAEVRRRLDEQDQEDPKQKKRPAGAREPGAQAAVIAALDAAATRIEQVTKTLNEGLTDGVPVG